MDNDGNGVTDNLDQCAATQTSAVDSKGCAVDQSDSGGSGGLSLFVFIMLFVHMLGCFINRNGIR
jgi:hypothetical protein